jgi:hypothetical protein
MFAQIFVAFGQGAGHLPVSDDAVVLAVDHYSGRIDSGGDWGPGAPAPEVLSIARVMGQTAAGNALRAHRTIITGEDYAAAREAVHRSSREAQLLIGRCPWP